MPRKPNLKILGMQVLIGMSPAEMERASNAEARADLSNAAKEKEQELPTEMNKQDRAIFESWGVKFLGPKKDDSLFQRVVMPKGWKIEATDHGMWYKVKDENGFVRASMFYKSAFYDRAAHINTCNRLSCSTDYGEYESAEADKIFGVIRDSNGTLLWRGTLLDRNTKDVFSGKSPAHDEAEKVLTEAYPDWKDPMKYWDLKEVKLPPSLSQTPPGEMYHMWVGIYRDRSMVDSGMNSQLRCKSDKEALQKFKQKAKWYIDQGYDAVEFKVFKDVGTPEKEERKEVGGERLERPIRCTRTRMGPDGEMIEEIEYNEWHARRRYK